MSTLGNILSNAARALHAHQKATQVAGHNINNALTEGYSRQSARLEAAHPLQTPHGTIGGGVRVADITRARDGLLDRTVRHETTALEGHRLSYQTLEQLEEALLEFGPEGLGATLDAFWDAWSEAASHPGNEAARTMIQGRGRQVAQHLGQLAIRTEEVTEATRERLNNAVVDLNRLASEVADLNRQIISAEAGGGTAADLRDRRDLALDELSKLVPLQVIERENGGVGVAVGGLTIVDDVESRELSLSHTPNRTTVIQTHSGTRLETDEGQIGALVDLLNNELPDFRTQLDELTRGIAQSVNELHREGVARPIDPATGEPTTGLDFFYLPEGDLANLHAGNLRLSDEIAGDIDLIAIGRGEIDEAGNLIYLAGNNDIAREIAQLRERPSTGGVLGEKTIGGYYQGIVTGLGAKVASEKASTTAHETLARQAETRRESVSGVSTDEELVRLIQAQSAYQAAARVITTVDEMLHTLLNI